MLFSKSVFTSDEFIRDPVPVLAKMRLQGELVRQKLPIIGKVWITTTQNAASKVLKDKQNFTVRKANGKVLRLQWWMPKLIKRLTGNMLANDEPEHKRLRSKVDIAFHRANITALEPRIRHIAQDLAAELFNDHPTANLMEKFARPFPLAVICELLGLPKEDREKFSIWADGLGRVTGMISFIQALRGIGAMTNYLEGRIEYVRNNPGPGLIHDLITAQSDDAPLTADELLSMVFLLLLAGHETTTHLISGGILALLQHPDQLETMLENPDHTNLAVEELLRYVSPVQLSKPRFAQADVTISGVNIKRGELVMNSLTAANFDPEVYENPQDFDITRKPNPHISFGSGIHFCLGHQLARLETKIALETLFSMYPNLQLAVPSNEIQWRNRLGLRALEALPVRAN